MRVIYTCSVYESVCIYAYKHAHTQRDECVSGIVNPSRYSQDLIYTELSRLSRVPSRFFFICSTALSNLKVELAHVILFKWESHCIHHFLVLNIKMTFFRSVPCPLEQWDLTLCQIMCFFRLIRLKRLGFAFMMMMKCREY